MTALGHVRRTLFGIHSEEAVFRNYGFLPEAWSHFGFVATSLREGYHAALEDARLNVLMPRLMAGDPTLHGFACEGAGMAMAALDMLAPWKNRVEDFAGEGGPAAHHRYPIYIGVGLALARLRRNPAPFLNHLSPVLNWVIYDGYGFHEAFFSWKRVFDRQQRPPHFSNYALRLFDQGLGRALWFASGAQVERVNSVVAGFPSARQLDIWSGVGMASSYAGGGERAILERARELAGPYQLQLAYGAAVAAYGRHVGGILVDHTRLACEVYCDRPCEQVAQIVEEISQDLAGHREESAHQTWADRIRSRVAQAVGAAND